MTTIYNLLRDIEELRLEAMTAPTIEERRQIEAELEAARAELEERITKEELP